ncbi:hypothetical protein DICPUDRAFT_26132 [Dictyostelium purpureum]|uniref:DUF1697 domain-containing protein n=1 Tax=Dictyostelium purpureum TaxID=5786 RepID=F0Z848_DICPU|nr:uncharacterized protein DICPUDRAFT_26132 [Dictyostelium purpureum]EGC39834.1 hypothetical protein DICPUDRAFT_26132 [Dictyostelium purpureum]|eukprot:XP_003283585.1 hypothetical protein DICPUDRAFT_26132 [Dictyostelium purpureum]
MKFLILLRSINISGKNIIKMKELREELGKFKSFSNIQTLIQTGNIVLDCDLEEKEIEKNISFTLENSFNVSNPQMAIFNLDKFSNILSKSANAISGHDQVNSFDRLTLIFPTTDTQLLERDIDESEKKNMTESCFWTIIDDVVFYNGKMSGVDAKVYKRLDSKLKKLRYTARKYRTCNKCLDLMK